jgi:arylsulfatase A-like enzyme
MADDLGYADLSCCGRRDFSTPNIDRIAERGVRFTQAYANSAVCSATRLALITGRYQYRLPLGLEEPLAGKTDVGLPPRHPTLPSLLRNAGYATSLIGKWHLGALPAFGPRQSGYDHFWGFHRRARLLPHRTPAAKRPLGRRSRPTDRLHDRPAGRPGRRYDQPACADGRPFLLSLHFNAPLAEAPGDQAESDRLHGTRLRHCRRHAAYVCAHGQAMDRQVGRVLQARRPRAVRQHYRRVHQRQRRRALGHMAVHRHQDGTAGRRSARARPALLADRIPAGRTGGR